MKTHLLHGLWTRDHGLVLWIEQIQGHKIVLPEQVPAGTFPPEIDAEFEGVEFRHRLRTILQTPSGRRVELAIPARAYTPEQAVSLFSRLEYLDSGAAPSTLDYKTSLAPDFLWLLRMYCGLEQFVKAGRVLLRCAWRDDSWWPQWQLASGMGEHAWVAEMMAATPGVISANGGPQVAEHMAEELPHWIASALLAKIRDGIRHQPWHEFSSSLLFSRPLRRGGPGLVSRLHDWAKSAKVADMELVIIVEEPRDDELYTAIIPDPDQDFEQDPQRWPVRVRLRRGVDAPIPIRMGAWAEDPEVKEYLMRLLNMLLRDCRRLNPFPSRSRSYPSDEETGEWDKFFSTAEIVAFVRDDVPKLRAAGYQVMLPKSWKHYKPTLRVETSDHVTKDAGTKLGWEQLVSYDWKLSLGESDLSAEEMQKLVNSKAGVIKLRGEWVVVDSAVLRTVDGYMQELAQHSIQHARTEIAFLEEQAEAAKKAQDPRWHELAKLAQDKRELFRQEFGEDPEALTAQVSGTASLGQLRALAVESSHDFPVEFSGSTWHSSLLGGTDTPAPERADIPDTVHASLREYQRRGVDWLVWMSRNNLGAILADDMGLGKTLQLLTLLAVEKRRDAQLPPTLVVCPTSVVGNWAAEAKKFVPDLKVLVHYGAERLKPAEFVDAAGKADLVITSYGVVSRDYVPLAEVEWDHVVLDEAQQIKNPSTRAAKAVRSIPARQRMALTGTPVENRLAELRSILDFCNPGILGSAAFFRHHFATAIERHEDEEAAERLRALTAPFILRRVKTDPDIVDDLPEKNEQIVSVRMTEEQAALYKALVDDIAQRVEQAEGMAKRGLVLATITKIKQICNHPAHFLGDGSAMTLAGAQRSGKVEALLEIVDRARADGERVLVFTQYRAFGDLLAPYLSERLGTPVPFLHGGVSKAGRDSMVQEFQQGDGAPVMILSLKAGGTGLNLTAASIVVHMDRWWNPAVENQATDRAFRIGQRRDVRVYKMVTQGTMEESIHDVIEGKLQLAGAVIGQGEGWITELSPEQLAQLMSYRGKE